jgi:S1-C subfamily serine protease
VRVSGGRAGTPAERAGLKAGDLITAFDGRPVKNLEDYSVLLFRHKPGDEISVTVRRGEETLELKAVLSGQAGEG